jgi:hypothetical protein
MTNGSLGSKKLSQQKLLAQSEWEKGGVTFSPRAHCPTAHEVMKRTQERVFCLSMLLFKSILQKCTTHFYAINCHNIMSSGQAIMTERVILKINFKLFRAREYISPLTFLHLFIAALGWKHQSTPRSSML